MIEYGLIGKTLSHSFSKNYFEKKFQSLGLTDHTYSNFELNAIKDLKEVLTLHPNLKGFNVTIPYKESIIPFLDELSEEARAVGAVNCVKILPATEHSRSAAGKRLIGHNTDVYGFASSVKPFIEPQHNKSLILGTGGAAKAVAFALKNIGVEVFYASSSKQQANTFLYEQLNEHMMSAFKLIVNTTPLGMFPNINEYPNIPYQYITTQHLCYDVIYNPEATLFLQKAKEQGATTINGLSMLQLQAEKSWEIWKG
jgi:shikimate dehydrogenase